MTARDPSAGGLSVTRRRAGIALVLAVAGEIDMNTAPDLQSTIVGGLEDAGDGLCIVDLTAVTFLGSAGLAALLEATSQARHRHQPLPMIVDSNRPVIRPIQVTGIDQVLALYHTVDEALGAFPAPEPLG